MGRPDTMPVTLVSEECAKRGECVWSRGRSGSGTILRAIINTQDLEPEEACTFFLNFIYFIYLFLNVLGLHCCAQAFFSCGERGLLFVAVRVLLLIAVASLVAEHGL